MVVRIRDAVKTFSRGDEVTFALQVADLSLETGRVTFLMGHNGSGKSVLARVISRELAVSPPHSLRILLGETEVTRAGVLRQHVDDNLACDLTVLENLVLRLPNLPLYSRLFRGQRELAVATALERFPAIHRKRHHSVKNLSVGQRQTLAFVAVACYRYPLLVLDEFLSATDAATSSLLRNEARQYSTRTPAAVCVISHDVPLALRTADRILVMTNGSISHDYLPSDPDWTETHLLTLLSAPDPVE